MNDFGRVIVEFLQAHEAWAAPIVLVLSFCESFAFVSLIVPATAILFGVGGLIGATGIEFWPVWLAAVFGAIAGDWLAYELTLRFRDNILHWWPLSRDPNLIARGITFFRSWGTLAVVVGRFFGPLRATVPIVAGLCRMPWVQFQIANVASAILWATGILSPGMLAMRWLLG